MERMVNMTIEYFVIPESEVECIRDLVNDLMHYQKSVASIHPEFFDGMSFDTRIAPALKSARLNHILVAKNGDEVIGYAYSTVADKKIYSGGFATLQCDAFFDFESVDGEEVGSLSQFFIKDGYRNTGVGSELYIQSMKWLGSFDFIKEIFIFVSNGNTNALNFYLNKGFKESHQILDGFITVLRNS